jgi:hypothetical protein
MNFRKCQAGVPMNLRHDGICGVHDLLDQTGIRRPRFRRSNETFVNVPAACS